MSTEIHWIRVSSFEGLARGLAEAREREGDTLLFNGNRWETAVDAERAVRRAEVLVSDADGTAYAGSQWDDIRARMTSEHRAADERDAAAYFRGERSDQGDKAFLVRSVHRMSRSGYSLAMLREDVSRQRPRDGFRGLAQSFRTGQMAIVSYGVHDYQIHWAGYHGIPVLPGDIFAAKLRWEHVRGEQVVSACDHVTVVVEATKSAARARFLASRGMSRESLQDRALVLEDTPQALARMQHPRSVGVLLVPRNDPSAHRAAQRERQLADPEFFQHFNVALVSDSLEPLAALRS